MAAETALSLRELRAVRDGSRVLAGLSLEVAPGQAVALLGQSGDRSRRAALEAACGLLPLAHGRVLVEGRDVAAHPPHRRGLALVAGTRLVGPTTVTGQVGFAARGRDIRPVLAATGLAGHARAAVAGLPPGLQRCVELARAAASQPACLLLDEPAAGLDPAEAAVLFAAIAALRASGLALLIATGAPATALALAERGVAMVGGAARQAGWLRELYEAPVDEAVAMLLGPMNRLRGRVVAEEDDLVTVRLDCGPEVEARGQDVGVDAPCVVCVRPSHVALTTAELSGSGTLPARVRTVRFLGPSTEIELEVGGSRPVPFTVLRPSSVPTRLAPGVAVALAWQAHHATAVRPLREA